MRVFSAVKQCWHFVKCEPYSVMIVECYHVGIYSIVISSVILGMLAFRVTLSNVKCEQCWHYKRI